MSVQQKLQKGRDRLNKAGNDSDLLGLALTSIHGALEDACRDWLSAPAIKQQHGIDVQNKSEANWQNILELMPKYYGWSDRDVRYVRKMNGLRNQAAHGDGFEGTRQDIEQYLNYVENAIAKGGAFSSSASDTYSFHNANNEQYQKQTRSYPQAINPHSINCPNCNSFKYKRTGIWAIIFKFSWIVSQVLGSILFFTGGMYFSDSSDKEHFLSSAFQFSLTALVLFTITLSPILIAYKTFPVTSFECLRCLYKWKEPSSPMLQDTIKGVIINCIVRGFIPGFIFGLLWGLLFG